MSNYIEVDGLRVDPCMWRSKVEEVEQLRARVAELCDLIKYAQENSGVCMCGDDIKDHNQSSGHPPVDVWDHAVEQVDQGETSEALILRKQAEAVQASREAVESEPVAVVDRVGIMQRLSPYTNLPEGTKLYTHPAIRKGG